MSNPFCDELRFFDFGLDLFVCDECDEDAEAIERVLNAKDADGISLQLNELSFISLLDFPRALCTQEFESNTNLGRPVYPVRRFHLIQVAHFY